MSSEYNSSMISANSCYYRYGSWAKTPNCIQEPVPIESYPSMYNLILPHNMDKIVPRKIQKICPSKYNTFN